MRAQVRITEALVRRRHRGLLALVVCAVVLAWVTDAAVTLYLREVMGAELLETYEPNLAVPRPSTLRDRHGRMLATLGAPDVVRDPLETVPPLFEDVLVRWEDARFYSHDGVDRYRLFGAVSAVLRGDPQGGSTLTMQWAKLLKKDSTRTVRRKLEDLALALALDAQLGKREVLRRYVNAAYFGHGVHGLGEACSYYFGKQHCEGLALEEAAYLVSLLRAPTELSLDDARARKRRDAVLSLLHEPGPVAEEGTRFERESRRLWLRLHQLFEHRLAGRVDLTGRYSDAEIAAARARPLAFVRQRDAVRHPFVVEVSRVALERRLGKALYDAGLEVRLTIDTDVQAAAEKALSAGLANLRQLKGLPADSRDDLDGGVIVLDPHTGDLLAYVPGSDFQQSQVPFAARPIQVGSTLKPFVYGELFEQELGTVESRVVDAPLCVGAWCPRNYGGSYSGEVSIAQALSRSLNTVAVRTAARVGVDALAGRLRLMGLHGPITVNLPMALGASELTLMELAGMYGALFDGRMAQPRLVSAIDDPTGRLSQLPATPPRPVVYRPATVVQLHQAMAMVLEPGGTAGVVGRALEEYFGVPAGQLGDGTGAAPQMACKTGTHDGVTRVGLACVLSDSDVGPVVVISYVGHRVPRSLGDGLTGGKVAGPVVRAVVEAITARTRGTGNFLPFPVPSSDDLGLLGPLTREDAAIEDGLAGVAEADREAVGPPAPDGATGDGATPDAADAADASVEAAAEAVETALDEALLDQLSEQLGEGETTLPPRRAEAPEGWAGLAVTDADTIEATAPALVRSYLTHGGRREELEALAPLLGLTLEHRSVQGTKLMGEGFSDHALHRRVALLASRAARSLAPQQLERSVGYEQPDPLTELVVEREGDRRVEHIHRFAAPIRLLRVSRHRGNGQVLSVEFVDPSGERRSWARRGGQLVELTRKRVVVHSGTLERAWLAAGLAPSQLDLLRALFGTKVDINDIRKGFTLDLLLADGVPVGAEALVPLPSGGVTRVEAIRVEGACLAGDGEPCSGRMLPVPLAEAMVYGPRGPREGGRVMVQRDRPGAGVVSTLEGVVEAVSPLQTALVLSSADGRIRLRLDGVVSRLNPGDRVRSGDPLGRLDERGVLVARGGGESPSVMAGMAHVEGAAPELAEVSRWWRTRLAWLRGTSPDLAEVH